MSKTIMDKNVTTVISEEEREKLVNEITNLLKQYDYKPTNEGVSKIVDTWVDQKGWLIELMKKHPNYVEGKYMIAFDVDYDRKIDINCINWFDDLVFDYMSKNIKPYKMHGFTYSEISGFIEKISYIMRLIDNIQNAPGMRGAPNVVIDGKTKEEYERELNRFVEIRNKMCDELEHNQELRSAFFTYSTDIYTKKDVDNFHNVRSFFEYLVNYPNQIVEGNMIYYANKISDKIRAKEGQRTSRLVNKICKFIGFNQTEEYNKQFAAFADAINPIKVKRHTIISCNPIDYFTMSFGNSWSSCHTIDKKHKRNDGSDCNYEGVYSGGTLSYMLDNSSVVFYTVDKGYNGTDYELEDKINRCMFHLGEDKLIQGRVYPQCNDGENSIYKTIREIAQKVFADCLNIPNLWSNYKGIDECCEVTTSYGCHYRDYLKYSTCNVSYLTRENKSENNYKRIMIGHSGICPCCGKEHDETKTIECYDCWISHN